MTYKGHTLRKGRVSLPNHHYLITMVTEKRHPWFLEPLHAQAACRQFYTPSLLPLAETLSFVVMPDHVHWLLKANHDLAHIVRIYKSKVTLAVGQSIWQRGYHDRTIRREEDIRTIARYIVANPLRAGLVTDIGAYPYWNAVWL
ncbi:REP-associated tyrosine transposase [Litchfieldella xinjiangensis]|uniref:REP-associated tyrosine transposase n=1 Tax=Litchfieldella xinjiangensis TaxID=1166948 RepID=UPI0005B98605|nr:transposase [Halomonas xinjiangensis]